MIANGNHTRKSGPIGMRGRQRSRQTCRQLIQLGGLHAVINLRQNLLGEAVGIDVETTSGLADSLQNLVEADVLKRTVALSDSHTKRHLEFGRT